VKEKHPIKKDPSPLYGRIKTAKRSSTHNSKTLTEKWAVQKVLYLRSVRVYLTRFEITIKFQ